MAPGTEDNPLAGRLADLIRDNVSHFDSKARDFARLRGSAALVINDAGTALTLRFDFGRLTLHDGVIGVPEVTILGDGRVVEELARLPISRRWRLPIAERGDAPAREARRALLRALRGGKLKVYGWIVHVRFVMRLLNVLSTRG